MALTHEVLWEFEGYKADGTAQMLSCSKPFNPEHWDDPREAAIFFTYNAKEALAAEGWHIGKPESIKVYGVRSLSDTGF